MKAARDRLKAKGALVRRLRAKRGWHQEELARKCDVDLRTIQRAEAGEFVSRNTAHFLSSALGVPWTDIVDVEEGEETEEAPNRLVLRPAQSALEIVEFLRTTDRHRLELEVDPTPEIAEQLIAFAEDAEVLRKRFILFSGGEPMVEDREAEEISFSDRIKITTKIATMIAELQRCNISIFIADYVAGTARTVWSTDGEFLEKAHNRIGYIVIASSSSAKVTKIVHDKKRVDTLSIQESEQADNGE